MALNRVLRLRKSSDFQRVRQQGRSIASRLLILAWTPNEQNNPTKPENADDPVNPDSQAVTTTRIGFVVSKRISKRAAERNYIKRLLGEAVRPVVPDISPGLDVVFSARNQVMGVSLPVLRQEVVTLLRRAQLLPSPRQVRIRASGGNE